VDQEIRDAARQALRREASEVDKVGPMRLRWSSPPIIEHMSPRMASLLGGKFMPGDLLGAVDGVDIKQHDREDVLLKLKHYKGGLTLMPGDRVQGTGGTMLPASEELACGWPGGQDGVLRDQNLRQCLQDSPAHQPEARVDDGGAGDIIDRVAREAGIDLAPLQGSLHRSLSTYGELQMQIRQAARDALHTQCEYDAIGPFILSWNPCKLVSVEEYAAEMFERKLQEGDELAAVGGTMCRGLSRKDILHLLIQHPGNFAFARGKALEHRQRIIDGARRALATTAPIAGPEWVGPLRFWWRKPATIVELAEDVHELFDGPVDPGSWFVSINRQSVLEAGRHQVLQLLYESTHLHVSSSLSSRVRAGAYLAQFKEAAEDPEWIGPVLLSWSSPCPTLLRVHPDFVHHFQRIPNDGDIVHGCSGVPLDGCSRTRILQIICDSEATLDICPAQLMQLHRAAAALLTTCPDLPEDDGVPAIEWVGPLRLVWTQPPTIVDTLPQAGKIFRGRPSPGDRIHKLNGKLIQGMTRREVLDGLKAGGIEIEGGGVRGRFRAAAALLLAEPGPGAQADWLGPVKLGWQTKPPRVMHAKPEALLYFPEPLGQGDQLVAVDGQPTGHLDRRGVLKLLLGPGDILTFSVPEYDSSDSADMELSRMAEPECEWVGKFRLLWSKPPTVVDMVPGASDKDRRPVAVGDLLVAVDGVALRTDGRDRVRRLMTQGAGEVVVAASFAGKLRARAVLALEAPPSDPEWVGPFQFRWTAPPSLADLKPDALSEFPVHLSPGDVLEKLDGCVAQEWDRDEVLRRLANCRVGLSFTPAWSLKSELRTAALACLDHPDTDVNQLGPITVRWTDPPTVLWMAESAQRQFKRRIASGERLVRVSGQKLQSLSKRQILGLLAEGNGVLEIAPAECPVM